MSAANRLRTTSLKRSFSFGRATQTDLSPTLVRITRSEKIDALRKRSSVCIATKARSVTNTRDRAIISSLGSCPNGA